jgi:hypothetical protein
MKEFKVIIASIVLIGLLLTAAVNAQSGGIIKAISSIITQAEQHGPRAPGLIFKFYYDTEASYYALMRDEIDIRDAVLTYDELNFAEADPEIILSPMLPINRSFTKYQMKGLPDFGQHSDNWCWVAALANVLYWLSENGYPKLIPKEWKIIDPQSIDRRPDGIDNDGDRGIDEDPYDGIDNDRDGRIDEDGNYWYCPCGNGYLRLMKEIAKLTPNNSIDNDGDGKCGEDPIDGIDNDSDGRIDEDPDHKVFCQPVTNQEYERLLDKLIYEGNYRDVLKWGKIENPGFDDYKSKLSRSQGVILVLRGPNGIGHDVTGASFNIIKNEIDISDPWTNRHNNNSKDKKYDSHKIIRNNPLTIQYNNEEYQVVKMYYISPIHGGAFKGYRNVLCGAVNVDDYFTFLKAYGADDQPIKYGLSNFPQMLNPIYSYEYQDWKLLERIYEPFIIENPHGTQWIPWLAQDWEEGTWIDPETGEEKTKLTYWFRKDAKWIQPITGNVLAPFTTDGYEFNCWYYYQTPDASDHYIYGHIHHIRPIGPYQVEIYFDVLNSYTEWMQPYFRLFAPAWKREPLTTLETKTFHEGVDITTPGYAELPYQTIGAPVEIVSITADGIPLKPYEDYEICLGRIRIYKDLPDLTTIEIKYWARGDAYGYTPGGLPWNEILIGTGAYYLVNYDPYVAIFNANRNYFLETPPQGEVDWYWWWEEGPKPRSGFYKINIYDVVMVTSSYGTQGRRVPDPEWRAEADLAPGPYEPADIRLKPELAGKLGPGKVDIYDVVTVTSIYGETFGHPPDP